jgi:hypothetical protein
LKWKSVLVAQNLFIKGAPVLTTGLTGGDLEVT